MHLLQMVNLWFIRTAVFQIGTSTTSSKSAEGQLSVKLEIVILDNEADDTCVYYINLYIATITHTIYSNNYTYSSLTNC